MIRRTWVIPVIASAIIGIIVGILFFTGTIPVAIIGIPIVFALLFAAISLILLFFAAIIPARKDVKDGIEEYGLTLIAGTVGTLIAGFFAITVLGLLVAGVFISALLIVVLTFFFLLTVITFVQFIVYLVNDRYYKKENYCE